MAGESSCSIESIFFLITKSLLFHSVFEQLSNISDIVIKIAKIQVMLTRYGNNLLLTLLLFW